MFWFKMNFILKSINKTTWFDLYWLDFWFSFWYQSSPKIIKISFYKFKFPNKKYHHSGTNIEKKFLLPVCLFAGFGCSISSLSLYRFAIFSWVIRMVMMALSSSPSPFVKILNSFVKKKNIWSKIMIIIIIDDDRWSIVFSIFCIINWFSINKSIINDDIKKYR